MRHFIGLVLVLIQATPDGIGLGQARCKASGLLEPENKRFLTCVASCRSSKTKLMVSFAVAEYSKRLRPAAFPAATRPARALHALRYRWGQTPGHQYGQCGTRSEYGRRPGADAGRAHRARRLHKEQPADSVSDRRAIYHSGAEGIDPIPIGLFQKNSMVYVHSWTEENAPASILPTLVSDNIASTINASFPLCCVCVVSHAALACTRYGQGLYAGKRPKSGGSAYGTSPRSTRSGHRWQPGGTDDRAGTRRSL